MEINNKICKIIKLGAKNKKRIKTNCITNRKVVSKERKNITVETR